MPPFAVEYPTISEAGLINPNIGELATHHLALSIASAPDAAQNEEFIRPEPRRTQMDVLREILAEVRLRTPYPRRTPNSDALSTTTTDSSTTANSHNTDEDDVITNEESDAQLYPETTSVTIVESFGIRAREREAAPGDYSAPLFLQRIRQTNKIFEAHSSTD